MGGDTPDLEQASVHSFLSREAQHSRGFWWPWLKRYVPELATPWGLVLGEMNLAISSPGAHANQRLSFHISIPGQIGQSVINAYIRCISP
jgi:hypothetical protein